MIKTSISYEYCPQLIEVLAKLYSGDSTSLYTGKDNAHETKVKELESDKDTPALSLFITH